MSKEEENMATVEYITAEDYSNGQREYWHQVEKSDGFDIEDVSLSSSMNGRITGLMPYDCQRHKHYPYSILVNLYAKLGLHRYNILEETSFEFASLIKFNMLSNCVSSFYITLLANHPDPAASTKTFQVRVDEGTYGTLDLTCSIARPKDEVTTKKPLIPHSHGGHSHGGVAWFVDGHLHWHSDSDDDLTDGKRYGIFKGELPDWPSDDDLNDGNRFYVLKESEWKDSDWVSMYLELVVCANDRSLTDTLPRTDIISQLEIVKVAIVTGIEDVEPEPLKAKNANVYITFKGLEEARAPRRVFETGKHVERQAIVRRVIDEHSGYLTLVGKLCGGQLSERARLNAEKKKSRKKRPRLD